MVINIYAGCWHTGEMINDINRVLSLNVLGDDLMVSCQHYSHMLIIHIYMLHAHENIKHIQPRHMRRMPELDIIMNYHWNVYNNNVNKHFFIAQLLYFSNVKNILSNWSAIILIHSILHRRVHEWGPIFRLNSLKKNEELITVLGTYDLLPISKWVSTTWDEIIVGFFYFFFLAAELL